VLDVGFTASAFAHQRQHLRRGAPAMAVAFFTSTGSCAKVWPNSGMNITGSKPKPLLPTGSGAISPGHAALRDQGLRVIGRAQRHQGADQGGAPVARACQLLQQRAHVVGVALFIAELRGVVGGVHARQATEGVDTQAGVVGQRGQAAVLRGMARLGQRVLDKGAKRLGSASPMPRSAWRPVPRPAAQTWPAARQLALVVGRQNDFHAQIGLQPSGNMRVSYEFDSDCRWRTTSSPMPFSARASKRPFRRG
jgi:hypothetical protein